MLTEKQIKEIKKHLDNAQNPLFFFDNDQDGLCSFLLLQRSLGRGKGFPIKSTPLDKNYLRKVNELNPDYLFILDLPTVSKEFFEEIKKINLPIVWIDHHSHTKKELNEIPDFVNYYNPFLDLDKKELESSTTYLCYEVTKRKEDLWLAIVGSISDKFVPPVYEDFKKAYPDLSIDSTDAFEIFYESAIGTIAQLFGHGLKDKTTNVIKMLKFLMKVKTPYEVLEESPKNKEMHERFQTINKKFRKFLKKAQEEANTFDKLVFFEYGGDTSMSSEISNGLMYIFPGKTVFVAYLTEGFVNISGRGNNVKKYLDKILKDLDNAKGGGHERAIGARIMRHDLDRFRERIKELVNKG